MAPREPFLVQGCKLPCSAAVTQPLYKQGFNFGTLIFKRLKFPFAQTCFRALLFCKAFLTYVMGCYIILLSIHGPPKQGFYSGSLPALASLCQDGAGFAKLQQAVPGGSQPDCFPLKTSREVMQRGELMLSSES